MATTDDIELSLLNRPGSNVRAKKCTRNLCGGPCIIGLLVIILLIQVTAIGMVVHFYTTRVTALEQTIATAIPTLNVIASILNDGSEIFTLFPDLGLELLKINDYMYTTEKLLQMCQNL